MVLKTISISVEEESLKKIDEAADKVRQSRSGYMEIAALERAKRESEQNQN